ncbi:MAG TPA: hypothetical protein VGJ87_05420 [Roseiflexaceae bacterium]
MEAALSVTVRLSAPAPSLTLAVAALSATLASVSLAMNASVPPPSDPGADLRSGSSATC